MLMRDRYDYLVMSVGANDLLTDTLIKGWYLRQKVRAPVLAQLLSNLSLAGTGVFYRTSTHVCKKWRGRKNQHLQQSNHLIKTYLKAANIRVLDTFKWTADCYGYEDVVHHSRVSMDHVLVWASLICPAVREFVTANCVNATAFLYDAIGGPPRTHLFDNSE